MATTPSPQIHGHTEAGFESVRELFERNMRRWAEEHAQLCIYHKGLKVVDLWGSKNDAGRFDADSLINVFSSGKSLEAIALSHLAGQGQIDYQAPIANYWPEFAQNGKDFVTVADLMRHEAGLANFEFSIIPEDLRVDRLKANAIGAQIEIHPQHFNNPSQTKREYHALTRGWIANELFRRADPKGRTIGEFIRDEISTPLNADVAIGVNQTQLERRVPITPLPVLKHFLATLRPRILGRKVLHNTIQLFGRLSKLVLSLMRRPQKKWPVPFEGMSGIAFFNEPVIAMGETPSANTSASARGLAKIAAAMAAGGRLDNATILPSDSWNLLHSAPTKANMGGFLPCEFTQGGVNFYRPCTDTSSKLERAFNVGREGFYGWMGLGGSLFQWHPEHDIGFAFVPTSLHMLDLLNERGKEYQAEVLRCVEALGR
jgi:CubicO group peptidase (beta-lactamase class C family)